MVNKSIEYLLVSELNKDRLLKLPVPKRRKPIIADPYELKEALTHPTHFGYAVSNNDFYSDEFYPAGLVELIPPVKHEKDSYSSGLLFINDRILTYCIREEPGSKPEIRYSQINSAPRDATIFQTNHTMNFWLHVSETNRFNVNIIKESGHRPFLENHYDKIMKFYNSI